ncbi:PspC domain-containing protein [Salinifilum ghardaiensis]
MRPRFRGRRGRTASRAQQAPQQQAPPPVSAQRPAADGPRSGQQAAARGAPEVPRLHRSREGRLVAGVSAGVADHLGVPVMWVRAAFAVLAGFWGAGILAYALLWVFVPQDATTPRGPASSRERQQGAALILLGLGLVVLFGSLAALPMWFTVPLLVMLIGAAVVWREADEPRRRRWFEGRAGLLRLLVGAALVFVGISAFLVGSSSLSMIPFLLLAVLTTLGGAVVLTVPWWMRLARDLDQERAGRIRSQERAEIAAHLHDSVLQTLALIQKQAEEPREVRRLARGQERELRSWLYGPGGYRGARSRAEEATGPAPEGAQQPVVLTAELARICGEVEDRFAVSVQHVEVSDCPLDERVRAQLAAAREAVTNAAKHSGEREISVYAEVEPERVSVFVRDRGAGFDPDAVSADRHGLSDSIRGRMERFGGSVRLRTAPGAGTEVQLEMPREADEQTPSQRSEPSGGSDPAADERGGRAV